MKNNKPLNKQAILSDPVSAYTLLIDAANNQPPHQLHTLSQEITNLTQIQTDIQLKTKRLSRKIGEEKRNGNNIDDLKSLMGEYSQKLKQLKKQSHEKEQLLLDIFKFSEKSDDLNTRTQNEISETVRHYSATSCNIDEITVTTLTDEHKEWNNYVTNKPNATIHQLSEWRSLYQKSYGHECYYYLARDNKDNIVGTLPLIRLKSRLFGDLFVSMPFFQRAGAIADHPLIEQKLITHANLAAEKLGAQHVEYRDDIPRDNMPCQSHKVNMVLSLPDTHDSLWQGFNSKLRSQIKRAQRENTQTIIGQQELINDFYCVYARNMRDLGSPLHSKQFITNILAEFPDNSWLIIIKLNNKPVSAGFLLGHKKSIEIPLASTIRDVNSLSMNMLLYWEVLQFAIKKHYQYFDFGRSTKNAGTYDFKKQWGAKAKPLYWHYWLKDKNELPSLNPNNPKFALVIFLWKRLPVIISKWLGPHITKNLP